MANILLKSAAPNTYPYFWSDFNETWWNRPGHRKNDPEGQWTQSGPELRRNGRFYVRPKSGFWPKNGFYPKKSPKMTFPPLIIWAKALFFFEQLFPVVARTWLESKSDRLFLGPKSWFLPKKSDFCHTTPILVNNVLTVSSPRRDRSFPTLISIFRLFVPELWPFLQKKTG